MCQKCYQDDHIGTFGRTSSYNGIPISLVSSWTSTYSQFSRSSMLQIYSSINILYNKRVTMFSCTKIQISITCNCDFIPPPPSSNFRLQLVGLLSTLMHRKKYSHLKITLKWIKKNPESDLKDGCNWPQVNTNLFYRIIIPYDYVAILLIFKKNVRSSILKPELQHVRDDHNELYFALVFET